MVVARRFSISGLMVVALGLGACGTTASGGGGFAALDAGSDVSLTFGKDIATAKDGGGKFDTGGTVDAGLEDDAAPLEDVAPVEDTANVEDVGFVDDGGFFDPDVPDTGKDVVAPKDTGAPKDTSTPKDTVTPKDTATDTGIVADVNGSCGNGTCDNGETCELCAVDCTCTPCNPLTSVGCTGASSQCYVNGANLVCGGVGKLTLGAACKNLNDCVKGQLCVSGTCKAICETTGTVSALACPVGTTCEGLATSSGPIGYNLGACFAPDNCNFVTSSGCPANQACMPGSNGKQCIPAGNGGLNSACTSSGDCKASLLCLTNGATTGTCKTRCDTTIANVCPVGQECGAISFGSPPAPAGDNLGVCDVP